MNEELINTLADEFCRWPLPESVCADLCATDRKYQHRTGTNLLTVVEARQMFRELVGPTLTALTAERDALLADKARLDWLASLPNQSIARILMGHPPKLG